MAHYIKHFLTITKHKWEVFKLAIQAGILFQGITHDLSKYMPEEFIPGGKFFTGTSSPNNGERLKYGHSFAWLHHKGRNKHHFEYWYDYDPVSKNIVPKDMPDKYIKEMFCDRVAASKVYNKRAYSNLAPLHYLQKSNAKNLMSEKTYKKILSLLEMLAEKGEAETLKFMRKNSTL